MSRMIWIGLVFALVLPMGCVDLNEETERECLSERRCGPDDGPVCGTDGQTYDCESVARCYGVQVDSSGDACESQQAQCEPVTCEIYCEHGFATDEDGCEVCACEEPPQCEPVACRMDCSDRGGFATDENGCEICECREEVQCEGVSCTLYCPNGFKTDEDGCEYCECREANETCDGDPCVTDYCASRQATCMRESELATMGACEPMDYLFLEPEPECECTENSCAKRGCTADDDCLAEQALCVNDMDADEGYCVQASCQDLIESYEEVASTRNSCTSDSDCAVHYPAYSCCGNVAVNTEGKPDMVAIDRFATQTSCSDDWDRQCANVDCDAPPSAAECVGGTCRLAQP